MTKVKVKFTLEQATKAHSGSTGKLYSFFNLGNRWRSLFRFLRRCGYVVLFSVQQSGKQKAFKLSD
jgi:hypothetical protein